MMKKSRLPVKTRPYIAIAAAILLVVIGAIFLFSGKKGERGFPPTQVEVIAVEKQPLYDKVQVLGSSYANESVTITSNITETIREVKFTDGQFIEAGDVIVVLEQDEEQAQLKAAELQLQEHERELGRLKTLLAKNVASKRDYDARMTMRDITAQQIEEIKARIKDRVLTAPFAGNLGIRQVSAGALVKPGDTITTIEDIRLIKLDFNIPSVYLAKLKPGIPIEAQGDAFAGMVFKGEIATINNKVDSVTRSILVRAVIQNPDNMIKPGMLMKVTLLKDQREGLVVPEEAVIQEGDDHFVMVVKDDNTIDKRKVMTGVHKEGVVEVVDFLSEGEKIIVRGVHKVRPGAKVEISKTWDKIRAPQPGTLGDN